MANISHQSKIENKKFRNWVKAGVGLKYVKEGLEGFCEDIVKQQHSEILTKVKNKHSLSTVQCGLCNLHTLQPDHVRDKSKRCPLGQAKCNCQYPNGKIICPNNVCGAIYDEITQLHASVPTAPFWRNSDVQKWCSEPWAVATCFINAPGYTNMFTASDIDCSGLLHLLINSTFFQRHLKTAITGTDVFSKVRRYRNTIFHSNCMELEENDVYTFLDDMISVLEDDKELKAREDSKTAVSNLIKLKNDDFVITTSDGAAAIKQREIELDQKMQDCIDHIELKTVDAENVLQQVRVEIEQKGAAIESEIEEKGNFLKNELEESFNKPAEIKKEKKTYARRKKAFQAKMMHVYSNHLTKVSVLPLLPERNQTDINDVYVAPMLTVEVKPRQLKKIALDEMFETNGNVFRNIFVLGEAGSGKSALCKSLISHWCLAHSNESSTNNQKTDKQNSPSKGKNKIIQKFKSLISRPQVEEIVKKMKDFEFLLYVSLRHATNFSDVEMMLKHFYDDQVLEYLRRESSKCLILLDGLDEWAVHVQRSSPFQTKGLPSRNMKRDYTIITTSRQWKFDSLHIKHSEANRVVKLNGLDEKSIRTMSEKTVYAINSVFDKNKAADDFSRSVRCSAVVNMSHIPLILQQLICLWYDDKLQGYSKCAIYSNMLNLYFEWATLRFTERRQIQSRSMGNIYLPELLRSNETCCRNARTIQNLSRLAFETLFSLNKEHSLCFAKSAFEHLNISDDVDKGLEIGILSADQSVAFLASKRQNLSFSFVHKSIQEYLCAVYVATEFERKVKPLTEEERNVALKDFVHQYFGNCETINDVPDLSNVFAMLSGLEPELTRYITEYIYSIVSEDSRVVEYRTDLTCNNDTGKLIENIQKCVCGCIKEFLPFGKLTEPSIYLGDVLIKPNSCPQNILHSLDKGVIKAESVRSLFIEDPNEWYEECAMKYLSTCTHVQTIKYSRALLEYRDYHIYDTTIKKTNEIITEVFVQNIPSLQTIVLDRVSLQLMTPVLQRLPDMPHLTNLQITNIKLPHEVCDTVSSLLERCTQLQQIVLGINCYYEINHPINLSNYHQLSCVNFYFGDFYGINFRTSNLRTCMVHIKTDELMSLVCENLREATNLKHLKLCGDYRSYKLTRKLDKLVSSLKNLTTLTLAYCTIHKNFIQCPSSMNFLQQIELSNVRVKIGIWCTFINSLSALPLVVQVKTHDLCCRGARCFVRKASEYFRCIDTSFGSFEFTTIK